MKPFKEVIDGIRKAVMASEVREDIAQGLEYVEQFANMAGENIQKAIDPTLSLSGKAADAAKVGEAVNAEAERAKGVEGQIKEDIAEKTNLAFLEDKAKNIYTSENSTAGYYLSIESGEPVENTEYLYSDYLPALPSTQYVASDKSYSEITFFVAEYDLNKQFLRNKQYVKEIGYTFTTTENTKYIRVSLPLVYKGFQIEKGNVPTSYEQHYKTKYILRDGVFDFVVGKDEYYKTISSAVAIAKDGDSIFVKNGTYDESVNCKGKLLFLVGESREYTKVIRSNNDYTNPPLNFSGGTVKNMSFIQSGDASPDSTGNIYDSYACHIDFVQMEGQTLLFENCYFESLKNAGCGMGGWNGSKVIFENCRFKTLNTDNLNGAIILHNNSYSASIDEFVFKDCVFIANNGAMCIKAQAFNTEGNHTKVTFINNSASHNSHWLSNIDTATVYKWSDLWNYELTNDSFGNKIDICNAEIIKKVN